MSIKVILADDHTLFRHGLIKAFREEQEIEIAGQAEDGCSAVELVRELSPDAVLMDISMPNLNGFEATRIITKEFPLVKVIGLSTHSSRTYIRQMFLAGASGYLLKTCEFEELVEAIKHVVEGKTHISRGIDAKMLRDLPYVPCE
jgi:DNA-binding NarL/FixJ family response regulator